MYPYLAIIGPEATAGGIFLLSLLAALVFHKLLFRVILHLSHWAPTDLASRMLRSTRWPATIGIVGLGGYLAIAVPLELSQRQQAAADKGFALLGIVLGIMAVVALVSRIIDWYLETLGSRPQPLVDARLIPLLRRAAVFIIWGLGALLVLDLLEINISPLIAGLGLGGLAVALAIQPTLANLFAGTYVMTEGVVSPGDYVELDGGTAGYVIEVGWRSTRIRTWSNNLVVVPNAKFAETIITNYQRPVPAVNVWLQCGVSYNSDLQQVERVCQEVMDEVLESEPTAVQEYGGWFGFDNFGDSNVNFWLFVQARDRLGSFVLRTVLIQKLHQRFSQEGIVINYPVRTLRFPKDWGEDAVMALPGANALSRRDGRGPHRRRRRRKPPESLAPLNATEHEPGYPP